MEVSVQKTLTGLSVRRKFHELDCQKSGVSFVTFVHVVKGNDIML